MNIRDPHVTSHALLRYIERVKGIDVDALRDEILTEPVRKALSEGASGVTVNGVQMVALDGVIVTILADGMRPKRKSRKAWRELGDINEPRTLLSFFSGLFRPESRSAR